MQLIILIGIQGSGKSTFFKERFVDTHIRISLDMLKTRRREKQLVDACLAAKQPLVVDNMNPTREDRRRYIEPAKAAGFRVVGYFFESDLDECHRRNERRPASQVVPFGGVRAAWNRLEEPTLDEGFAELYSVRLDSEGGFVVEGEGRRRR